jgi:hypothetical protein
MRKWMIFADEAEGRHVWFDGHSLVGLENGDIHNVLDLTNQEEQELLHNVLETPRKRLFTSHKTRYVVVARGTRYEP